MSKRDLSFIAYGELSDGTHWDGLPVTIATRVQWERTAQVNKWSLETHALTFAAFLSWHTAKRAGIFDLTWDEFVDQAIEANVDKGEEEDPEGPTTPTASTSTA